MIGREKRMLLRHYLEQGGSKSALARQLGISRDTVHRWIRAGDHHASFTDHDSTGRVTKLVELSSRRAPT